uniref:Uncharacterized protein n=1 Tax=Oryza sativa subsp. japonica TaxID=39947 RepID=Q6YYM7_ORYSJ|nr:hypothetical protein [Oryza sativa Japonica Group]
MAAALPRAQSPLGGGPRGAWGSLFPLVLIRTGPPGGGHLTHRTWRPREGGGPRGAWGSLLPLVLIRTGPTPKQGGGNRHSTPGATPSGECHLRGRPPLLPGATLLWGRHVGLRAASSL